MTFQKLVTFMLLTSSLVACTRAPMENPSTSTSIPPTNPPTTNTALPQPTVSPPPRSYEFPVSIDPAKPYLFYVHGKIIEDQGLPAISPDYGLYQYEEILATLAGHGFVVISETRLKDTDGVEYARKLADQVMALLEAGVPAKNITVVGASKGAGIAIYVSHFLREEDLNFVILGVCHPDVVEALIQDQVFLVGNVLSIYDASDEYAGSCQELFSSSAGKGISEVDEIVLNIGTGHGILYKPMDEWILPTVQWAGRNNP